MKSLIVLITMLAILTGCSSTPSTSHKDKNTAYAEYIKTDIPPETIAISAILNTYQ